MYNIAVAQVVVQLGFELFLVVRDRYDSDGDGRAWMCVDMQTDTHTDMR